jgi:hypothetical protein
VMFLTGTKSDACDFGHISDRKWNVQWHQSHIL